MRHYLANMLDQLKMICFLVLVIVCSGAVFSQASPKTPPQRIVSLNLCTDQLLMMLVEPSRIAAVTHLARQPTLSPLAARAAKLPINHGKAEEVFLLNPDLVLVGTYTAQTTVNLLRRLQRHIVTIAPANSFADIFRNIEIIGNAVGEQVKAEKMITDLKAKLEQLDSRTNAPRDQSSRPLAALYFANGYSSGRNTLADEVVKKSGFRTLGEKLGFSGTRKISLEALILARPDVLITEQKSYDGDAMAYEIFGHPALHNLANRTKSISLRTALTICGTPETIKAVEMLQKYSRLIIGEHDFKGIE